MNMPSVHILHNQTRIKAFSQMLLTCSNTISNAVEAPKDFDTNMSQRMSRPQYIRVTALEINTCCHTPLHTTPFR